MYIGLHVKYPLFLSGFKKTWIFSTDFGKIFRHQISWQPVQWEPSCSMRTDGQTDGRTHEERERQIHDEANSRFSQFCERPPKKPITLCQFQLNNSHRHQSCSGTNSPHEFQTWKTWQESWKGKVGCRQDHLLPSFIASWFHTLSPSIIFKCATTTSFQLIFNVSNHSTQQNYGNWSSVDK